MKALLVSSNPETWTAVLELLQEAGIRCERADPGALRRDGVAGVDALVVDLDSLDASAEPEWERIVPTIALVKSLASVDASWLANFDDFITEPQLKAELLARLDRVLHGPRTITAAGGFSFDRERRLCSYQGKALSLTPREADVLNALLEAQGRELSRTDLLKAVWGIEFEPESKIVEVAIARLRAKIGGKPSPIETVPGKGYRIP